MPAKNHIHTYERISGEKTPRYKCADPDCSHVVVKNYLPGKRSKCWGCGQEFILTKADLKLARPHCGCLKNNPRNDKQEVEIEAVELMLEKMIGEVKVVE